MSQSKGIVLAAFGNKGYIEMAWNMAFSIKFHNPELKITLLHDDYIGHLAKQWHFVFDSKQNIEREDLYTLGRLDPGKFKCNLYKYLPYDHNLFLDVDGLCMGDLEPEIDKFIEKEGYYYAQVLGKGKREDKIEYSIWADNDFIWEHFDLGKDQEAVSIQSSYAYFQRSKEAEKFYKYVAERFEAADVDEMGLKWGGTKPDELFYSGAISKFGIDAHGGTFVFFGMKYDKQTNTDIENNYKILSLFGNTVGSRLVKLRFAELYDGLMFRYTRQFTKEKGVNMPYVFKRAGFEKFKHVNTNK